MQVFTSKSGNRCEWFIGQDTRNGPSPSPTTLHVKWTNNPSTASDEQDLREHIESLPEPRAAKRIPCERGVCANPAMWSEICAREAGLTVEIVISADTTTASEKQLQLLSDLARAGARVTRSGYTMAVHVSTEVDAAFEGK